MPSRIFLGCLPLVLSASALSTPSNVVSFGVWFNSSDCSSTENHGVMSMDTEVECLVTSYTDPDGLIQTNTNTKFCCNDDSVTWTQYPGSDKCPGTMVIDAKLTTECLPVETHMGVTYQKLIDYDVPCDRTCVAGGDESPVLETCSDSRPKASEPGTATVGFWSNTGGGQLGDPCPSPCDGDPIMTNTFPVDSDADCVQWPGHSGENSAMDFVANDDGSFSYVQWTSCTCEGGAVDDGVQKTAMFVKCVVDNPTNLCAKLVSMN